MSYTFIDDSFNHLFEIGLGGGLSLQPRSAFDEIPQDGMFTVDELGDLSPVVDPSIIDDPYFDNDGGDIIIKTLI
jgi:hypothetical protein